MPQQREDLDQAYNELRRLGYKETVFDFQFVLDEHPDTGAPPTVMDVLVTNTENHVQKHYPAVADGSTWQSRFCKDVGAGDYGPPPKGVPEEVLP